MTLMTHNWLTCEAQNLLTIGSWHGTS